MSNQEVMSTETIAEQEAIAQRMAERANENTRSFATIPTLTIFNSSKNAENTTAIGSIVRSIKTENGYENELFENPFTGLILKVRMYLSLKYKYSENKPRIITNEFDSYSDDEVITVKEQDSDKKYQPVFVGNYKQVNDKYSLKDDTTVEKKLDLHHAVYVLRDFSSQEVVRLDFKGLSRSAFFDYMKTFTRRGGDFMTACWTTFGTEVSNTDFNGKPRRIPVASFTFTKGEKLTLAELRQAEPIQIEFDRQLLEREKAFGNVKEENKPAEMGQPAPQDELPTIQLEDEPEVAKLIPDPTNEEEEGEVKIEDVPF